MILCFGRSQKEKFWRNSQEAGIYRGLLRNICAGLFPIYCLITAISPHKAIRGVKFSILLYSSMPLDVSCRTELWSKRYFVLHGTTSSLSSLQEALINIFPHRETMWGWRVIIILNRGGSLIACSTPRKKKYVSFSSRVIFCGCRI